MGDDEKISPEFLLGRSGLMTQLVSVEVQVPSPAQPWGLRICLQLWAWELPCAMGVDEKGKKKMYFRDKTFSSSDNAVTNLKIFELHIEVHGMIGQWGSAV